MANRSWKKKASGDNFPAPPSDTEDSLGKFLSWTFDSGAWIALLLAMVAFLAYRPSLTSDFVYDARKEILDEGFITSLSNLPSVLSLKVLSMNLMLGSRPGQMLYLMLNAALWGKDPFGYHLTSNLLHAANVALLFLLLLRLAKTEIAGLNRGLALKVQIAAAAATLIFALHPIAVESVSEVSYSSSLLVTFFTLVALLAANAFSAENVRIGIWLGCVGTFCAFAAVTCKESGIAVALILIAYWFLFRRSEAKWPWFFFLSAASIATAAFLATRFMFPPPAAPNPPGYLGGSFSHVFWIQPRLWVFIMGKLFWPSPLSANYSLEDLAGLSTPVAAIILAIVVLLQTWLAIKSPLGALGVAVYWLGLVAVSNFIPLFHPMADRYYYLPLAGLAMQIMALLLATLRWKARFWLAVLPVFVATVPLGFLTLSRETVFASNLALWRDTVQASPLSETAHYSLGTALSDTGQQDEAIIEFGKALQINPNDCEAYNNLGIALFQKGQPDEAIEEFRKVLEINSTNVQAHYNLGLALLKKGEFKEAVAEFNESLILKPDDIDAQTNLAKAKAMMTPKDGGAKTGP